MNLDEHLDNNKRAILIHKPSIYYGFIIGFILGTIIMFANRPMTLVQQMGCKESVTVDVIKGHTITGCSENMKRRKR